jgi:RNA polymerase sigma-70 factor, ECF subfamily
MADGGHDDDDDAALVRATLAGRTQAFGLLYDRYAPLVRAVCFDAAGDLTQAQDLSQEAFLRAYRKLTRLRDAQQFGPWLIGIAKHVCRESRRSGARGRRKLELVSQLAAPASEEVPSADEDDDLLRLRGAIAALPPREREALHLFYLQEQPADAAAKLLGLSRSGFYRAIERARIRLQRMLGLQPTRRMSP